MNFSEKYHRLKRTFVNLNKPIWERMEAWDAISTLLVKTKDEKAFSKYAKRLFNTSFKIIVTSPVLSEYAVRFTSLSNKEKEDFGQRFLNILTASHKLTPVRFELRNDIDNFDQAAYSYTHKLIGVLNDSYTLDNLGSFMCMVLHEFTHHVYEHCPTFGPLPVSQIKALTENGYLGFEDSKDEPLEAPARFVEEYLREHNFAYSLLSKIKQKGS